MMSWTHMPNLRTMAGVYRESDSLEAVSFYSCEHVEGGSIVTQAPARSDSSSTAPTDLTLLAQTSEPRGSTMLAFARPATSRTVEHADGESSGAACFIPPSVVLAYRQTMPTM